MADNSNSNSKGKKTNRDYEIGKGKPPKASQFPPGVSGNPSGRPKRPPKLRKAMSSILVRDITLTVNGHKKTMPTQEALLFAMITKALKAPVKHQLGVIDLLRELEGEWPVNFSAPLGDGDYDEDE